MDSVKTNRDHQNKMILRVLFFTLVISVMNAMVFNVVLPNIKAEFGLNASLVSWITTGYMVFYAIGSVTFGKLADQYRLKDLITIGLMIMSIGSIIGLFASQFWMIIIGRMLQAAGASVIPALAMIIPIRYFPPAKRGRALGIVASGLALGNAIAPIVGGFATSLFQWRSLFLLSILALFTVPFYRKYLDDEKGAAGRMDYLGGLGLASMVALVLLAITHGDWALLLWAVILFIMFIWRIHSTPEPFVQPALFLNKKYTTGVLLTIGTMIVGAGTPFIMPQMLEHMNHLTAAWIGFVMFPGAIASAILGSSVGKLADKRGNAYLFYIASSLLLFSFVLLTILSGVSPIIILFILILVNLGQTCMQVAMMNTVSQSLPKQQAGIGMGLCQMLLFMSGAISTAVIGKALDLGANIQLNPFLLNKAASAYSNVFLALSMILVVIVVFFYASPSVSENRSK